MSHTNSTTQSDKSKTSFKSVFKEAVKLYKKYCFLLFGLFIITAICASLAIFWLNITIGENSLLSVQNVVISAFVYLLIHIFVAVFALIAGSAFIKIAISDEKKQKISLIQSIKEVLPRLGEILKFELRYLIYTLAWISPVFSFMNKLPHSSIFQQFPGFWSLFGVVYSVLTIFILIRAAKVFSGLNILIADEVSNKKAWDESLQLSKKIGSRVYANFFLLALTTIILTVIALLIISIVLQLIFSGLGLGSFKNFPWMMQIIVIITLTIALSFVATFNYAFTKKARE